MNGKIIDISPVLSEDIAVWPGDVQFQREVSLSIADGANLDLSAIRTTVHLGAHADAPSHYAADGDSIAERDLGLYLGPCQVIEVRRSRGERILPEHIAEEISAPRVLLCTGSFPDPCEFNRDFNSLSPELVDFLHEAGVRLVGIDTPSVDPFQSTALESHQALARHDMANLEGLVLVGVPPGRYTLVALPLRLAGADASPVRAVLVETT